jgi:uncharacterized Zn-finger protein
MSSDEYKMSMDGASLKCPSCYERFRDHHSPDIDMDKSEEEWWSLRVITCPYCRAVWKEWFYLSHIELIEEGEHE